MTERIYVHSKLLIVDDAVAIVGSANTNDRSLSGDGDSEIAAVVVDTEDVRYEDLGNGNKVHTRKFARDLRRAIWRKHLGMELPQKADDAALVYYPADAHATKKKPSWVLPVPHPPRVGPSSQNVTKFETWLNQPASPATWKGIVELAKGNTSVYQDTFPHIPRNSFKTFDAGLAYYPDPQRLRAQLMDNKRQALHQNFERIFKLDRRQGGALEAERQKAHSQIDQSLQREGPVAAADVNAADLAGIPPVLAESYMRAMEPFQTRLAGYLNYLVSFNGEPSQQLVHDCTKAIKDLRSKVVGFWVLAPLEWGQQTMVINPYTTIEGVDLSHNEDTPEVTAPHVALALGHEGVIV